MSVRFNAPAGWPIPLPSWAPGDDWMPDPSWPAPAHGWTFWVVVEEQAVPDLGEVDSGYGTDRESWLASLRLRTAADALEAAPSAGASDPLLTQADVDGSGPRDGLLAPAGLDI
jgi:hypothetical protein